MPKTFIENNRFLSNWRDIVTDQKVQENFSFTHKLTISNEYEGKYKQSAQRGIEKAKEYNKYKHKSHTHYNVINHSNKYKHK